jgi:hypothetical protein
VLKRTAHLTVRVAERPVEIAAVPATPAPKASRAKAKTETAEVAKAPVRKGVARPKKAARKSKTSKK